MYATGVPTSLPTLLQSLATFASANGWTVDENAARAGYDWILSLHKGDAFFTWYTIAGSNALSLNGATTWAAGIDPTAQANALGSSVLTDASMVGPFTGYHFFTSSSDAIYLHVVVEISAGIFRQLFAGELNRQGGASPALYLSAVNWSTGIYQGYPDYVNLNYVPFSAQSNGTAFLCNVDGTMHWFINGNPTPTRSAYLPAQTTGLQQVGFQRSPNSFNGLAPLFPIGVWVERGVGNLYSYIGNVVDAAFCNIGNSNPKDEIAIGADTWKVFPVAAKGVAANVLNGPVSSGNYAFAFRKNG